MDDDHLPTAKAFVRQMDEAAIKLLDEPIAEENDAAVIRRYRVLLSFWLGLGRGAVERADEADTRIADLEAEIVQLRAIPRLMGDALMDAANIDRRPIPFED